MGLSKSSVDKAGEKLCQDKNDSIALNILAAWRNKHIYPLAMAFNLLKKHTDKVGNNAIYGQRLKRVSSILYKLARFSKSDSDFKLKLSQLQDIGGCRVILSSPDKLRDLYKSLKKSRSILLKHTDRITYPKPDGYRGIHLIYKCGSKNSEYAGLKIELQLRTVLQHAWATAVEIVDLFEDEKLKIGQGSPDWLRFFYLVAEEFAIFEQLPLHDNRMGIRDRLVEIKLLCDKLDVINKLKSYRIATDIVSHNKHEDIKSANFFVLELHIGDVSLIKITPFKNQTEAQEFYINSEKECINNSSMNILMVKMDSINKIKKSYLNYFANSKIFLEKLTAILEK